MTACLQILGFLKTFCFSFSGLFLYLSFTVIKVYQAEVDSLFTNTEAFHNYLHFFCSGVFVRSSYLKAFEIDLKQKLKEQVSEDTESFIKNQ